LNISLVLSLYNNAVLAEGITRDRVGTMILKSTYVGTFERDDHAKIEGNFSAFHCMHKNCGRKMIR
jgi:hypothetical protein